MAVPLEPVLLAVGLLLATTGVFVYRVALLGFGGLLGGAGGMLTGVATGADFVTFVALAGFGSLVGIYLVYSAYKIAILAAGALTGLAGGMYVAGASLSNLGTLADPMLAVGLVVGVVAGWVFQKPIVIVVSAAWGASLVSIALAPTIEDPTNIRALVDAFVSPALLAVFVLGIGVQTGLWAAEQYYGDADTWFGESDQPDE